MRIKGTTGNDGLGGTLNNDVIYALSGDDYVVAQAGKDYVRGGPGNDQLEGNEGNDRLRGDAGDDSLNGGEGVNRLSGGAGNDWLEDGGGYGSTMHGGTGNDTLATVMCSVGGPTSLTTSHGGRGADTFLTGFQLQDSASVSHILDFNPAAGDKYGFGLQLLDAGNQVAQLDSTQAFDVFDSNNDQRLDDLDEAVVQWGTELHIGAYTDTVIFHGVDHLDFAALAP